MNYLVGFIGGIIALIVLAVLNAYVFNYAISDFCAGFTCCAVCYIAKEVYEDSKR